jgi:hypothetical protein
MTARNSHTTAEQIGQQIIEELAKVYTPDGLGLWLDTEQTMFNGEKPATLILSGRAQQVLDKVKALVDGVYV